MACYGLQIGCEQYKPQFVVVSARICICAYITARAHTEKNNNNSVYGICAQIDDGIEPNWMEQHGHTLAAGEEKKHRR